MSLGEGLAVSWWASMNTSWDAPDEEAIPPIPAAGNSNGDLPMLQFATQQVLRVLFRWLEEKAVLQPDGPDEAPILA
jgi:hypothetical protein